MRRTIREIVDWLETTANNAKLPCRITDWCDDVWTRATRTSAETSLAEILVAERVMVSGDWDSLDRWIIRHVEAKE